MELRIIKPTEDDFIKKIEWNFEELKQEIITKTADYKTVVYSKNQIKDAKADRAKLNKLRTALEDKRKDIKKQCLIPYQEFESSEKELVSIIDESINSIDAQIKEYDEIRKEEKKEQILKIYEESIGDLDRSIPFEKIFKDKWLNASTSLNSIREEISAFRDRVNSELKIINNDMSKYVFEMKKRYLENFSLSEAMEYKNELEENERQKQEYERQEQTPVVTQNDEAAPLITLDFRVVATRKQLDSLKKFLTDNNIQYGPVPKEGE